MRYPLLHVTSESKMNSNNQVLLIISKPEFETVVSFHQTILCFIWPIKDEA